MAATKPSLSTLFESPQKHQEAAAQRAADTRAAIAQADPALLDLLDGLKATFSGRLVFLNTQGLRIGNELAPGVTPSPPVVKPKELIKRTKR